MESESLNLHKSFFPAQKKEDPITSVKTKAHITNKPNER